MTHTPTTIPEALAAWQAARQAHDAAMQADLEALAVGMPLASPGDVLALVRMTLEPGDGCSAASEALIARAHQAV